VLAASLEIKNDSVEITEEDILQEKEAPKENKIELKDIPAPEKISSESYMVASLDTGEIFLKKNSELKLPIASITKLMTAIVADENLNSQTNIQISPQMLSVQGFKGNIKVGDVWKLEELYFPLLLESDNHAAHAISVFYGQSGFIKLMDEKAKSIGMVNTSFGDSSGLRSDNISTVSDLFALSRYLIKEKSYILDISKLTQKSVTNQNNGKQYVFRSNNPFRNDPHFLGGKNGFTNAARKTLVSVFETEISGETHNIAIVTLKSNDHTGDTRKLLEWFQKSVY
jgi:serine-type D-Ala-D-Ala carboxypeptidase (penicillin-binding protein 5/6)